jgi:hypothetical protein
VNPSIAELATDPIAVSTSHRVLIKPDQHYLVASLWSSSSACTTRVRSATKKSELAFSRHKVTKFPCELDMIVTNIPKDNYPNPPLPLSKLIHPIKRSKPSLPSCMGCYSRNKNSCIECIRSSQMLPGTVQSIVPLTRDVQIFSYFTAVVPLLPKELLMYQE